MAGQRTPRASRSCNKDGEWELAGPQAHGGTWSQLPFLSKPLFLVLMRSLFSGMPAFLFCGSLTHMPSSLCPLVYVKETAVRRRSAIPQTRPQVPGAWGVACNLTRSPSPSYLPLQWPDGHWSPLEHISGQLKNVCSTKLLSMYSVWTSLCFGGKRVSFS